MIKVNCDDIFNSLNGRQPKITLRSIGSVIIIGGRLSALSEEEFTGNNNDTVFELSGKGSERLRGIARDLMRLGVLFESVCVNVIDRKYGDDFVAVKPYADLLILDWVNQGFEDRHGYELFGQESPLIKNGDTTWPETIQITNPVFVANVTDNFTCVSSSDIEEAGYQQIHHDGHATYIYSRPNITL